MRFLVALAVASIPLTLTVSAQVGTGGGDLQAPVTFESAQSLASRGRVDAALEQLNQLAARTPVEARVERLRGNILYEKEQFAPAAAAFAHAVNLDPADRESIAMQGIILFREGHSPEAIPFLERAHAASASLNVDPQYVLGLCYADTRRYDDARHAFAAQFGFAPDSPEAHLATARLLLRREFVTEAGGEAQQAIAINPNLPFAHQLLGEVALARADVAGAIRELESERRLNPMNADMYYYLGDAYYRNEQFAEAQAVLNKSILIKPEASGPYILLGACLLKQHQPIQAFQYLKVAERKDPSSAITHNLLGQAFKAVGNLEEANRQMKLGVELQHGKQSKSQEK